MRWVVWLVSVAGVLLAVSPAPAQSVLGYLGNPTHQQTARALDGSVITGGVFGRIVAVTKTVAFTSPDGKTGQRTICEYICEPTSVLLSNVAAALNAHTADRQPITEEDLLQGLEKETVVFVCDPLQKADPAYVSLLKPETICLFLPAFQPTAGSPAPGAALSKSLPAKMQPAAALAIVTHGKCIVRCRSIRYQDQTAMRTVQTPDGPRQAPYSMRVTTTSENTFNLPVSEMRGYDMDGKPVDSEALAAALAAERPVLISVDGLPVDPAFLEIIKPGTLILAFPPPPQPGMAPPVGASSPPGGVAPRPVPAPVEAK